MEVKKAVESMLVISGKKKQDIAKFLQISKPSFTNWLDKMDQIKRFIKICDYCGFTVIITDKKNISFDLTENTEEDPTSNQGKSENK